jgi:predicted amidophosphoribosyltransferase
LKRRYNQAALLGEAVAKTSGLDFLPDALLRTRATATQTGLKRAERVENVRGAFAVNPRFAERLKGRRILLIDDVFTTGVTLGVCSETLFDSGAGLVAALTLARRV